MGSGKTYAIVLRTLRLINDFPGIFVLIGAQTYPLLRDTTLRSFREIVPNNAIVSYNKSTQDFVLWNGSEVIFRSYDDETKLKSLNLGAAAIEEMTDVPEEVFKMLRTRMRQKGMPGCIYGATNPGVFGNWVYKYFIEKPIEKSKVIYSITADNDYLPNEYLQDLETLRNSNPEYYERMVMGKWGALEGLVYNLPMSQRVEGPPSKGAIDGYIAGLDFGFNHPTACLVIAYSKYGLCVVDELYRRNMSASELIKSVKEFLAKYRIDAVYCDSSRPEIIADLQGAGIPAIEGEKDVFEGIIYVKGIIGSKELTVCKNCTYTLREFDSYIWDAKNTIKEVPIKLNDDCLDSLRYCVYSTRHHRGQTGIISAEGRFTVSGW